uniref:Sugar transporter SWEET1 n=1 Tax=Piliocolobus tephrosceles TaxID=591936 RepID=A0A8C9IR99_9PRIM
MMEAGGFLDSLIYGACVIFTLGMFSAGLSDLRHMRMTRSVDNVQFLPFLTTEVNNLGWLSYGALKADGILIVVNTVGAALQTLYILAYLHYCPRKARLVALPSLRCLCCLPWASANKLRGKGFCLQQNPWAKVIQTKSTQCLSYPLTIATLLTSASWCLYGFRLRDPYIMVSNFPGIVTSFIRFWLFWKYPQEQDRNYWLLQT